jgi:serine protease AprX
VDQRRWADRPSGGIRSTLIVLLALLLVVGVAPAQSAAAADNELQTKVDPTLLARARGDLDGRYAVIVRGSSGGSAATQVGQIGESDGERAESAVRSAGATVGDRLSIVGGTTAVLSGRQIITLARHGNVARVMADSVFPVAWEGAAAASRVTSASVLATNAATAWSRYGVSGRGVGVAVLDSGVAAHPDLAGRVVASVDFVAGDGRTSAIPLGDAGGHGTHLAGIIAGDGTASSGAYTGIAPRASIVSVRVIDAHGMATLSRVLAGMQWILGNRAAYNIRVLNISFGAPARSGYQGDLLAAAAETLNFAGVLVVAAAGNGGGAAGTIISPATDPFVLTVGAIDDHGSNSFSDYSVPGWSSRGPTPFDRLAKPDVVAPGTQVVSLRVPGSTLDAMLPDSRVIADGDQVARYFSLSGSSAAAAMAVGTAALLIERYPAITTAQLRHQLTTTARPLGGYTAVDQGAGLIDAAAAAARTPTAAPPLNLPVSDVFALLAKAYLKGQPFTWIDLGFNGGVDSNGRRWADVNWGNVVWDGITWQNLDWEAFTWQGITWQGITWQGITWQGVTWQGITWAGITWQSARPGDSNNREQVTGR